MRNPERLDSFYEEMKNAHKTTVPDWRFGQLIYNFMREIGDPFYLEDDKFISLFKEWIAKYKEDK